MNLQSPIRLPNYQLISSTGASFRMVVMSALEAMMKFTSRHQNLASIFPRTTSTLKQPLQARTSSVRPRPQPPDLPLTFLRPGAEYVSIMADNASDAGEDIAAQYDLLPKLIPNLDRHLIYPLLNFGTNEDEEQPLETKKMLLELLKPTNMTDFVGQLYQDIHDLDEAPAEYAKKREEVLKRRDQLEEETSKISGLLDDEAVVNNLRSDKVANLSYLKENHGVTVEMVNQLYKFGQFQYSCGVYPHAAELLYRFRVLVRYFNTWK